MVIETRAQVPEHRVGLLAAAQNEADFRLYAVR